MANKIELKTEEVEVLAEFFVKIKDLIPPNVDLVWKNITLQYANILIERGEMTHAEFASYFRYDKKKTAEPKED